MGTEQEDLAEIGEAGVLEEQEELADALIAERIVCEDEERERKREREREASPSRPPSPPALPSPLPPSARASLRSFPLSRSATCSFIHCKQ